MTLRATRHSPVSARRDMLPSMSNQPTTDQTDHVIDHRPANHADQEEAPRVVTLDQAASELGITVNAVRQRLKRGTLTGIRTDTGWLVDMSTADQRPHAGGSSTTT